MTTFRQWYDRQPKGRGAELIRSGIASAIIQRMRHGATTDSYRLAKRISEATGGEVSIAELCGDVKPRKRGAK